ncbi:hypothetical protein LXL04_029495 [Taraxacum kok-saghyz]
MVELPVMKNRCRKGIWRCTLGKKRTMRGEFWPLPHVSLVKSENQNLNRNNNSITECKAQGIKALGLVCHVSNEQQRKNLIQQTVQKYGKIDVIVSNAAANPSAEN